MGIPSAISEHISKIESEYPAPSEKATLNKAIEKAKKLIQNFPYRPDIIEEKFHLADLYVGRGNPEDYEAASELYEEILKSGADPYLKARCLAGKAELIVSEIKKEEKSKALEYCKEAQNILVALPKEEKNLPTFPFFLAKAHVIEADVLTSRDRVDKKGKHIDHINAIKIHEKIIKNKKAPSYFRARSLLGKAELLLYHYPRKLSESVALCSKALILLKNREKDYFHLKSKIIEAEARIQRGIRDDFKRAENLLKTVIVADVYPDLTARAKLSLAEISRHPKARKLLKQVQQTEGLDPYIVQKVKQLQKKIER